jgi:cation:H+ antiporter
MLWSFLAVVAGFALLVWGADRFVIGAAALARNLGISTLIIGLTIVGFATSAPEMLVSSMAAWEGNPGLGIGNAIGSNIANIALVLGVTAMIKPMTIHSGVLQREYPLLFIATLFALILMLDQSLSRLDGALLLLMLFFIIYWIVQIALHSRTKDPMAVEYETEIPADISTNMAIGYLLLGLIILLASSRLLVWGAVNIAQYYGISDLVIGLTIIAIGTSLPELAASVVSAFKGEHDIAIGNVIGSNMFNILGVLGLPGLIHPLEVDPAVLHRDFPLMVGLTIGLFFLAQGLRKPGRLSRGEGVLLSGAFIAYLLYLGETQIY